MAIVSYQKCVDVSKVTPAPTVSRIVRKVIGVRIVRMSVSVAPTAPVTHRAVTASATLVTPAMTVLHHVKEHLAYTVYTRVAARTMPTVAMWMAIVLVNQAIMIHTAKESVPQEQQQMTVNRSASVKMMECVSVRMVIVIVSVGTALWANTVPRSVTTFTGD